MTMQGRAPTRIAALLLALAGPASAATWVYVANADSQDVSVFALAGQCEPPGAGIGARSAEVR